MANLPYLSARSTFLMKENLWKNHLILFFFLISCYSSFCQSHKFKLIRSDQTYVDQNYPDATVAEGNVHVTHLGEGVSLKCDKAFFYKSSNTLKVSGNVVVNQGDTLYQNSKYATYEGNRNRVTSWGGVLVKNRLMELQTDSLIFDRSKQQLYFEQRGTIKDPENTLQSNEGRYHLTTNRFEAIDSVSVFNIEGSKLNSDRLEYYTNTGVANIVAPTTISTDISNVYTENGYYNTKNHTATLNENSVVKFKDIEIKGNQLYYEKNTGFYKSESDFILTDAKNKLVIRGGYGELYVDQDSLIVSDRAILIKELKPKDSIYMSCDLLTMHGEKGQRKITASKNVKFFNKQLQGVSDLIESDENAGIVFFRENPIVWTNDTQIKGDSILVNSSAGIKKRRLDSIQVFGNAKQRAFVAKKDSISGGYNQLSGETILGYFTNGKLSSVSVKKTPKSIIYLRDKTNKLMGIDKKEAKKSIEASFQGKKISSVSYLETITGKTIGPGSKEADNIQNLKGFSWHESKQPKSKEAIFE